MKTVTAAEALKTAALLSYQGKPIIALPSTTSRWENSLVNCLKPGTGIVTKRANIHYVVTEYAVPNLYGKKSERKN